MTENTIPQKLVDEDFRFILVKPQTKAPSDIAWNTDTSVRYPGNHPKITEHLLTGGNVGVLSGIKELGIIDIDTEETKIQDDIISKFPPTFTVRSGSGKYHLYFKCSDATKSLQCRDDKKGMIVEFRWNATSEEAGGQVPVQTLVPPSIHPDTKKPYTVLNDRKIAIITFAEIKANLSAYLKDDEKPKRQRAAPRTSDCSAVLDKVTFSQVLSDLGTDIHRNPTMCPFGHESKGQRCFSFNDEKQIAHCYNCGFAGDVIQLIQTFNNLDFASAITWIAEKYKVELPGLQSQEPTIKFGYFTDHLPKFELVQSLIHLHGLEYVPAIKASYYRFLSFRYSTQVHQIGTVKVDGRLHILYILQSGGGKKNFKIATKKIGEKIGLTYESPTTLHPEQLIGKMLEEQIFVEVGITSKGNPKKIPKKEWIENRGYLNEDIVDIDEGHTLLSSDDLLYTESRQHICIACDSYGENLVSKRSVNNKKEHSIKYCPHVSLGLYSQNLMYPQEIITKGVLRRFIPCYIKSFTPVQEIFYKRLESTPIDEEFILNEWRLFYNSLPQNFKLPIGVGVKDAIRNYADLLVKMSWDRKYKAVDFANIFSNSILELMFKMSLLLALARKDHTLEVEVVQMVFMDLCEMLYGTYEFVDELVEGKVILKGKIDPRLSDVLVWLDENGAHNQQTTTVTIEALNQKIQDVLGVEEEAARKRASQLERTGWIAKVRAGQHGSKVWLIKSLNFASGTSGNDKSSKQSGTSGNTSQTYQGIFDGLKNNSKIKGGSLETLPVVPLSKDIPELVRHFEIKEGQHKGMADEQRMAQAYDGDNFEEALAYSKRMGKVFDPPNHKGFWKVLE